MLTLVEPHNMYLFIAVEYGLLVLACFLLLMGRTLAMLMQRQHLPYAIGLVGFMLQALGSSHLLVNVRVAILFWVLVGSTAALSNSSRSDHQEALSEHGG